MILRDVERYLQTGGLAASTFGKLVANDPKLVHELRRGRRPGKAMIARIEAWIGAAR